MHPHMPHVVPSATHGVSMPVGDPPLAAFSAVDLRDPQGVGAWLSINRDRSVLQADGEGHVAHLFVGQELELERRAVGETLSEMGEELVYFLLTNGTSPAPRTLTGSLRDHSARRGAGSP
jgi:hypothetical protein